jgi:hypothetical protein
LDYWGSIPGNTWSGRVENLITHLHLITRKMVDGDLHASSAIPQGVVKNYRRVVYGKT